MKILIIGGNRYVGKRLSNLMLQAGFDVTLFNRHSTSQPNLRIINGDRRKHSDLQKISEVKFDVIYDFACFDANEAQLALDFFEKKTSHYIFISSQSVYGPGGNLHEKNFDPWTFVSGIAASSSENYALTKQQAEKVFYQQTDIKVSSIRFPIILGNDDYTKRLQWHIDRIKKSEPIFFSDIKAKISFVHADDGARALFFLKDHLYHGPLNVASPHPISLLDLISKLENKYQKTLVSSADEKDHSPYGISSDWWMNCDHLKNLGFTAQPIEQWLDSLV